MVKDGLIEITLKPGYYFSPGFYLDYWTKTIMTNFDVPTVVGGNKLKRHREMWVGAHLAAAKTKLSGEKHFVSLPETEPPDVVIGTFRKIVVPSGRTAHKLDWYPIEITRCDAFSGEILEEQIEKKNRQAYERTVLAVYLQGAERVPDLQALAKSLRSKKVHLHEVIVMVQLQGKANNIAEGSFGFVQVHPFYDTIVVNRDDSDAFFHTPNVRKVTGRGIQSDFIRLGQIKLLPPK